MGGEDEVAMAGCRLVGYRGTVFDDIAVGVVAVVDDIAVFVVD